MNSIAKSNKKFYAEIGKPLGLKIDLNKKFDSITISIGYYLIGISKKERFVSYYETHTETEILFVENILDDIAVQSYDGKLISVKWFIELEADNLTETLDLIVYPLNYEKVFGK